MNNTGLVLEGGAMRGLFTMGVLDTFLKNDIIIPNVVGVSAGAAFGCNYKSRQIGRALRYNLRYCGDWRYCSMRSLIRTGDLFGAEFCYKTLPFELDPFDCLTFDTTSMDFWVVCTDVLTGKPVYHRIDRVDDTCMDWIRASASMPMVSRPVTIGSRTLLDGGMSDSIPLKFMTDKGIHKNVVILTQPRDYVKSPAKILPLKLLLHKYPAMIRTMKDRHTMYAFQRAYVFEQEKQGSAFVICPEKPLAISRTEHDPDRIRAVYDEGVRIAEALLPSLKAFLKDE
ncbi:MAG: patatin family protein [Ruminococcus sp.]|nr:patatin family protein [Ruminococcus sp.]